MPTSGLALVVGFFVFLVVAHFLIWILNRKDFKEGNMSDRELNLYGIAKTVSYVGMTLAVVYFIIVLII